ESRLQQIMDNSPAVVFIKDLEGRYLFVNRQHEKTFHVLNADIQGRNVTTLFPLDVARAVLEHDRLVVESGQPLVREEIVPHDDGPHVYLAVKFPLRDTRGSIYAVCGIATD